MLKQLGTAVDLSYVWSLVAEALARGATATQTDPAPAHVTPEVRDTYTPMGWLFRQRREQLDLTFAELIERISQDNYPRISNEVLWRAMAPKTHPRWRPISLDTAQRINRALRTGISDEEMALFYSAEQIEKQRHVLRRQAKRVVSSRLPPDVQEIIEKVNQLPMFQRQVILERINQMLGQ